MDSATKDDTLKQILLSKEWLTDSPNLDMGKYCSEKDDMVFYHSSNNTCMNKGGFTKNCALMFPKHRKFVNYQ